VALLDGEAHQWRKQMFMSLMTPESMQQLAGMIAAQWRATITKWETMDQVVLFDEAAEILCRAVCRWTGVPLMESEAK
jgi:fatty-acid peroxygenase